MQQRADSRQRRASSVASGMSSRTSALRAGMDCRRRRQERATPRSAASLAGASKRCGESIPEPRLLVASNQQSADSGQNPASCFLLPASSSKGQALVELAIFGSLLILVLGALLSYGLNSDYTQQSMMEVFRKAIGVADPVTTTGGGSVAMVKDRYTVDPGHPFAVGSSLPVAASGSVIRDFALHEAADIENELPRMRTEVQGQAFDCPSGQVIDPGTGEPVGGCTTAGFRLEQQVHPDSFDRYAEIYGGTNICKKDTCDCGTDVGGAMIPCGDSGVCTVPLVVNPVTGLLYCPDNKEFLRLRIIDSCEGEASDYNACKRQARQMVDEAVCVKECQLGRWGEDNDLPSCEEVCGDPATATEEAQMNLPWYAQGATEASGTHAAGTHQWTFPNLDQIFLAAGLKAMGLQPSYTKQTSVTMGLATNNTPTQASTTSALEEDETVHRTMVYMVKPLTYPYDPATNGVVGTLFNTPGNVVTKSKDNEDSEHTWTTGWGKGTD